MQVKAAVQVAMHKDIDFQRKKSKGMWVKQLFSLTVDDLTQKTYCIITKKLREGFKVFCRAFSNTQNIQYRRLDQFMLEQRKNENIGKFTSQNYANFCEKCVRVRDSVILMLNS